MPNLPSRNRRFDLYEDPFHLRARRTERLIEAIRSELAESGTRATLRVRPVRTVAGRRARLEYECLPLRYTRTSYLTPEELDRLSALVPESNGRLKLRNE
jgi:hypothetical protein